MGLSVLLCLRLRFWVFPLRSISWVGTTNYQSVFVPSFPLQRWGLGVFCLLHRLTWWSIPHNELASTEQPVVIAENNTLSWSGPCFLSDLNTCSLHWRSNAKYQIRSCLRAFAHVLFTSEMLFPNICMTVSLTLFKSLHKYHLLIRPSKRHST